MNAQVNLSRLTIKALIITAIVALAMICCSVKADASTGKLKQSTTGNTTSSVSLKWDKVAGATSYELRYDGNVVKTAQNKMVLKNLSKDKEVWVSLYWINSSNYATYIGSVGANPLPTKVTGLKLDIFYPSINSAWFAWNKKNNADGYQFKVYTGSGKTKVVDEIKTGSYPSTNIKGKLKVNRFYKAKLRAYVVIDGKRVYGSYSNYKYVAGGPKNLYIKKYTSKMAIKWSKVSGATTYTVYVSTTYPRSPYSSNMTKVKVTKSNKMNLTKFKGKKYSKKKTYYVYVVANKKVGKTYYKSTPYGYYIAF